MKRREPIPMPAEPFVLLLVEGGDEEAVCRILAGDAWKQMRCRPTHGRDFLGAAELALRDPNFGHARAVGLVLDAEHSVAESQALADQTKAIFRERPPAHSILLPGDGQPGAIETLCRRAVRNAELVACVDALVACAGAPHAGRVNPRVAEDKGWLRAYLGMLPESDLRFHQAFAHPHGIDASHPAFDGLREFLRTL